MPRKEPTIVHPLAALEALEALEGYHQDVSLLAAAVQSALSMMARDGLDPARVWEASAPEMQKALDRVRRWYDSP